MLQDNYVNCTIVDIAHGLCDPAGFVGNLMSAVFLYT